MIRGVYVNLWPYTLTEMKAKIKITLIITKFLITLYPAVVQTSVRSELRLYG